MMTKQELVKFLDLEGSIAGRSILALSARSFSRLMDVFNPEKDYLVYVCEEYAKINRGKVGMDGLHYDLN